MDQNNVAAFHRVNVMQQETRGHALRQQGGGGLVAQKWWKLNEKIGPHRPNRRIRARRGASVADAIAGSHVRYPRPDALDEAGGFEAENSRRGHQVKAASATVNVNKVDANGGLPNSRFARSWISGEDLLHLQYFRSAIAGENDRGRGYSGRAARDEKRGSRELSGNSLAADERFLKRTETRLDYILRHETSESVLLGCRRIEGGSPFPKAGILVSDSPQPNIRDIVAQKSGGFENAVGKACLDIGERKELFPNSAAVHESEIAHGADLILLGALFDPAGSDSGMPTVMAIEIAQDRPHRFERRPHDGAATNLDHSACKQCLQRAEPGGEDVATDIVCNPVFAIRSRIEFSRPFGESVIVIRDGDESHRRHIIFDAHRTFENRVCAKHLIVGQRQEPLANSSTVVEPKIPDTPDLVGRRVVFDPALHYEFRPIWQTVEVAHDRPDGAGRRWDHDGGIDLRHLVHVPQRSSSRSEEHT